MALDPSSHGPDVWDQEGGLNGPAVARGPRNTTTEQRGMLLRGKFEGALGRGQICNVMQT